MASQNQSFVELVASVFEYVAILKQQLADAVASDKAKDEVIAAKNVEAVEAREVYEDYVSIDNTEDEALAAAIEKFYSDLEIAKQS